MEGKRRNQIHHNVVVVPRIQRDIATRFGDRSNDVQSLVAVERRDLYRDDVFNFRESAPERVREKPPAYRRLQVETDNRKNLRYLFAVDQKPVIAPRGNRTKTQESRVILQIAQ